ncbi:MAG: hypothetical protein KDN20_18015 [Verrucomicrobiae bacterium]|nr:hypothetical protein [Verrucomicrobiae bacterium]
MTAPDTLIARWEPTAVGIKQLMDGEISGSSVRRVALVRASSSESICVGVFDEDLIGREFIGGIRVPLSELALGTNELIGEGMLNHCSLAITEATDELALPSNFRVTIPSAKSVEWLEAPPSEMEDPTARLAGETGSFFNDLAKEIGKKLEQEIRQSSDAAASAIKDLKHTANKAESTGKPALPIEDSK